jgi:hypothetical protein
MVLQGGWVGGWVGGELTSQKPKPFGFLVSTSSTLFHDVTVPHFCSEVRRERARAGGTACERESESQTERAERTR